MQNPSNVKVGRQASPGLDLSATGGGSRLGRFLDRHGRKLWWLHSAYALALGAGVVAFARKGFEHARWLAVSLGFAWLLVVLLFRIRGAGGDPRAFDAADPRRRVRFFLSLIHI